MKIPQHPAQQVIDSTKLKTAMKCLRRYFFQHVLGWKVDGPSTSIHLVFGSAWHFAMEHLLKCYQRDGQQYSLKAANEAMELFLAEYRKSFDSHLDIDNAPKDPGTARVALEAYIERYGGDDFNVLETEIAGTCPVGDERNIWFKIDAIIEKHGRTSVLEHKTSSLMSSNWADQWPLSVQVGTYIHALNCYMESKDIEGLTINGTFLRKKGVDFMRVPIRKAPQQMEVWLETVNYWLDTIEDNMKVLEMELDMTHLPSVMTAFPMNTESCLDFGQKCPYFDFCAYCPNPLKYVTEDNQPQPGFKVEYWDPNEEYKNNKVVHL